MGEVYRSFLNNFKWKGSSSLYTLVIPTFDIGDDGQLTRGGHKRPRLLLLNTIDWTRAAINSRMPLKF